MQTALLVGVAVLVVLLAVARHFVVNKHPINDIHVPLEMVLKFPTSSKLSKYNSKFAGRKRMPSAFALVVSCR
jgi:hypothetical protein